MGKRVNDTESRKNQILQAAKKLFIAKGYNAATVDDIAREVGIVKGTVLHYFTSKDKLFIAVLDEMGFAAVNQILFLLQDTDNPVMERLKKLIKLLENQSNTLKAPLTEFTSDGSNRFHIDYLRLKTYYKMSALLKEFLDEGCREKVFHISDTKARSESLAFAVFGVTGSEISSAELSNELYEIFNRLLSISIPHEGTQGGERHEI